VPRSTEQNEAMRAATRTRIETAATALFAVHGFAATSIRDIAAAAGISTGLLYRHYASKDELFDSLVGQAATGLGLLAERFNASEDPAATLVEFTTEFLTDLAGEGAFAEFFLLMNQWYVRPALPAGGALLRDRHAAMFAAAGDLIERGQRLGQFRADDPSELITCYFATLSGLATMRVTLDEDFALPRPSTVIRLVLKEPQ